MGRFFRYLLGLLVLFSVRIGGAEEMALVYDQAGRKVIIPTRIERVVGLSSSLRYIVYLQALNKVVGIEGIEKRNSSGPINATGRLYWLAIRDRIKDIPTIGEGGPGKLPDLERLLSVRPEVVFTFERDNAEFIQRKTNIPVLVISYAGTEGFEIKDIKETFSFLGKILKKEKRAEELNQYLDYCIEDLTRRTSPQPNFKIPTVYIGAISARGTHGITSTESHYPPLQWIRVKNVADNLGGKGHIFVDKEKLLAWDPDYLFIDAGGIYLVNEDYLKNKEFYQKLKAVREGKVYTVFPYNFYRTNLEVLIANAYFIGKIIYPQDFIEVDPDEKMREVLTKFLGKDVYGLLKQSYKGFGKVEFNKAGIIVR